MQFSFFLICDLIILTILTMSLALLISIPYVTTRMVLERYPFGKHLTISYWHLNNNGMTPTALKEVQWLRKEGSRRLCLRKKCVHRDSMYLHFIICENNVHGTVSMYRNYLSLYYLFLCALYWVRTITIFSLGSFLNKNYVLQPEWTF